MRFVILLLLVSISGSSFAHQWTPTYPKLTPSYVNGVVSTVMVLLNKRKDIRFYEMSVYDTNWKRVPFVTNDRVTNLEYLDRKRVEIFVREKDASRARYICSKSKIISTTRDKLAIPSSRICSKIKE